MRIFEQEQDRFLTREILELIEQDGERASAYACTPFVEQTYGAPTPTGEADHRTLLSMTNIQFMA